MRQEKQTDLDPVTTSPFETWWREFGEVLACGLPDIEIYRLRDISAVAFESGVMSILKEFAARLPQGSDGIHEERSDYQDQVRKHN